MAYLGDGNNVCSLLMVAVTRLGGSLVAATPEGYESDEGAPPNPLSALIVR